MSLPTVEAVTEALEFYGDPDSYVGHEQSVLEAARAYVNAVEFDAPHTVDVPGHYLLIKVKGPPKEATHANYNTGEPCFCDAPFDGVPGPCLDAPEPITGSSPENGSG